MWVNQWNVFLLLAELLKTANLKRMILIYVFCSKGSKDGRTDRQASGIVLSSSLFLSCSIGVWNEIVCHSSWRVCFSSCPRGVPLVQSPRSWRHHWCGPATWCMPRWPGGWPAAPWGTATSGCGSRPYPWAAGRSWRCGVSQPRRHLPHLRTEQ